MRLGAALVAVVFAAVRHSEAAYFTGGTKPLPSPQQAVLDRHEEILSLGLNTDWLATGKINSAKYMEAVDILAGAVREGVLPGAVIMSDRLAGKNFPLAIGYLQTDPGKIRNRYDSLYAVDDMTGALITAPLAYGLLSSKKFTLATTIGAVFPAAEKSRIGGVTVEQLLRHSSGVSGEPAGPFSGDGGSILNAMVGELEIRPPGVSVNPQRVNMAILGLMIEQVEGRRLDVLARERLYGPFEMATTTMMPTMGTRMNTATSAFSAELDRFAWAEPADPMGRALEGHAGHTGLLTCADDVANLLKLALAMRQTSTIFFGRASIPAAFRPSEGLEGGETMGLGVRLGRFGRKSFGWDSSTGSSLWVLPEHNGMLLILTNADHPNGMKPEARPALDRAAVLLAEALGWSSAPIDTPGPLGILPTAAPTPRLP